MVVHKNTAFRAVLDREGIDAFADAIDFLDRLAAAGIRDRFSVLVDGVVSAEWGIEGEPAPDIFLAVASELGGAPARAVVAEDASSGVEAARRGAFGLVLGIAKPGSADVLLAAGADAVVRSFTAVTIAGED